MFEVGKDVDGGRGQRWWWQNRRKGQWREHGMKEKKLSVSVSSKEEDNDNRSSGRRRQ